MPLHAPGEQKATPSASEILFLFGFREIDSSITRSLQPGVLGEMDLHGNKSSTVEEKKEKGRKSTAATTGKPQELPKVDFPLFSIHIGDMCSEICTICTKLPLTPLLHGQQPGCTPALGLARRLFGLPRVCRSPRENRLLIKKKDNFPSIHIFSLPFFSFLKNYFCHLLK